MRTKILTMGALLLFTPLSLSQVANDGLGKPLPNGNWLDASGKPTHVLPAQSIVAKATGSTGFAGLLGCARDKITGHYWISSRGDTTKPTPRTHMLFEFDKAGKFLKGYLQPVGTANGSSWGIRDMTYDGKLHIYGSCENAATKNTVFAFNVVTKKWDTAQNWVVPSTIATGTVRALGFDPNGNKGNGSMWTANWSSVITEFSKTGTLLRSFSPGISGPSTYGAGYDPVRKTMWFFGQRGSTKGTSMRVVGYELDTATGKATGSMFLGDTKVPGSVPGGIAGGMEFYTDLKGRPVILYLTQASPDSLVELYGRFQHGKSSGGDIGMSGDAPYTGNSKWTLTLTNSPSSIAIIMIGTSGLNIPLPTPPFASGSALLIGGPLPIAGVPVTAGKAQITIPIPAVPALSGANSFWQWAGVGVAQPISLSTGGYTRIY